MNGPRPTLACPCEAGFCETAFFYHSPPPGEVVFELGDVPYRRRYDKCRLCGHFFSRHDLDMSALYSAQYVNATYGDRDGLRRNFERIINLPPDRSDNRARAQRVRDFADNLFGATKRQIRLVDVGAGLGVFPHAMQSAGWDCTAIDPDERAVEHLRTVARVKAIHGNFETMSLAELGRFDIVTFNKVLEHVEAPVSVLARSRDILAADGFVYVEVPDGEAAAVDGPGREEFFIDHHHVFSPTSLAALAERAGFRLAAFERLREPSSKFTLRGFLVRNPAVDFQRA